MALRSESNSTNLPAGAWIPAASNHQEGLFLRHIMKTVSVVLQITLIIIGAVLAHAQGTGFTYQVRLAENGSPYNGNAEFQATLWSVPTGGTVLASNSPPTVIVPVTNGLFVLPLDFGANLPGAIRWLQLEVRTT